VLTFDKELTEFTIFTINHYNAHCPSSPPNSSVVPGTPVTSRHDKNTSAWISLFVQN